MTHEPVVDVVMCTNRVSSFLDGALASLQAQTYRHWRLIVVDDGSGRFDDLERVLSGVPGSELIRQDHAGPATARNAGIRAGHGDVVTFLDDDDLWPADRLAASVRALAGSPEAIGVFGDGIYIDEQGRSIGTWRSPPSTTEDLLCGTGALPRITTLSLRRAALEAMGLFTDGMYFAEDTELTLRAVRHGDLVHAGAALVMYRRHTGNATRADWRAQHRAGVQAIALNADAALSAGADEHVRLLSENRRRFDRSTAAGGLGRVIERIRSRRYREAVAELWDSFLISPVGFLQGAGARFRDWFARRQGAAHA